jgi:hypothetical protein
MRQRQWAFRNLTCQKTSKCGAIADKDLGLIKLAATQKMKISTIEFATKRSLTIALLGLAIVLVTPNAQAVFLRGQPFTPTGANFTISAAQAINASHPTGTSGFNPQVNGDFEFQNSIGVSYDQGNGHLKDFGIGLYQDSAHNTQSTGLRINYNQLVQASSVTITIEDFDINTGDTFFKTGKVEPSITLFGPGGSVFATLSPTAIFPHLVANTSHGSNTDVWDLNFGAVLSSLHLADGPITGFLLYADALNGEQTNSDPYLLVAVGPGIPTIPEPSNYLAGLAALVMLGGYRLNLLRKRVLA